MLPGFALPLFRQVCPEWPGCAKKRPMEMLPIPPLRPTIHPLTYRDERQLREHDDLEWRSEVVVTTVLPELEMVVARAENLDLEVHLTDSIPGVQWKELCTGQHLRVKLVGILAPRVVSAEIA